MKKVLSFIILSIFLICFKVLAEENNQEIKKVLVLPFKIYSQSEYSYLEEAIPEMLTSRLFSPSKIEIIEIEKVKKEIENYEKINKEIAQKIGNKFKVDYIIWGSVTILGKTVSIDAQIMDLSGNKKPVQFFQEMKDVSEIIPQLSRFAHKARRYIEKGEEDFYQEEPYYAMVPYGLSKEHPERGYYYYAPYLYPTKPQRTKPKVTRAKSPFGDFAEESLTKNLVIDISKGTIGWAEEEKEKKNKENATATVPNYPPIYPPQPYYPYSPPPYYYYQEDEGILSKLWSRIWPFGGKEKTPKYSTQVIPASQAYQFSQSPQQQTKSHIKTSKQSSSPQTTSTNKKNPWSWE